jgi:2'-5' RNA ligase
MHQHVQPETLRLFIACGIGGADRRTLEQAVSTAPWTPHWRMIEPASWHVTALFIGNVHHTQLVRVQQVIADEAHKGAPLMLSDGRLQSMPQDAPTMRWIRFLPNAALTDLHGRLAHRLSLPPSPYDPFWPHITLARARGNSRQHMEGEGQLVLPRLVLGGLSLYRSDPGPDGRTYRPVFTRPFAGEM